ncbi:GNAT family N-acetyltransferase [Pseudogemmobacter sonorensis]|uniref:GNAT family N-acetyltransferase n=1 Tax=Pseudogemmobacter sonorensis TaxID=2989681 RepID=UPI0036A73098
MYPILARPYRREDLSACLSLFDGNASPFFAPEERAEFQDHLNGLGPETPFLVLTQGGRVVVACGGLSLAPMLTPTRRSASMSWGMVDRRMHGQGLGRRLTEARLALARRIPGLAELTLSTSQHSRGFYERLGFTAERIIPGGFGPGLDRWDMIRRL